MIIPPGIIRVFEVKECSPFGWVSPLDKYTMLKICEGGDIISIHTNPLWGGSWEWLEEARKLTTKPILAKGFHDTITDVRRAFNCGANHVLTVGWWPGDDRCWHECESLDELRESCAAKTVWNARNPRTGEKRHETIQQARGARPLNFLCQASGIMNENDIGPVDAVLIGAGLYQA